MSRENWLKKCRFWKEKWPVFQPEYNDDSKGINIYKFIEVLNQNLKEDSVITWDAGSSLYCTNQGLKLNGEQRSIGSLAQAEMGAALGIAAGVSFAKNKEEVICVIGDGSFNTNPQTLAVIRKHNLPVKIFVLNNGGYLSIKNTQDKFFEGRRIGASSEDGLFFPEIENFAKTYNIQYWKISKISEISDWINAILKVGEAVICEVVCQELQEISPGITASKNADGKLEQNDFSNMAPFIENIQEEMIKD